MLALTVRQPFASQLASGARTVLLRPHVTSYRGPILITSASYQAEGGPLGCTLCVAELMDVSDAPYDFAWHFSDVRPVARLAVKGRPGLWPVPTYLLRALGF